MKRLLLFLFSWGCILPVSAQTIRYVYPGGFGNQSGSSWLNASPDVQAMINASNPGDQVWVSLGTYRPTHDATGNLNPADPRMRTFTLKQGVKVFGGFRGNETALAQRQASQYAIYCILSGDLGIANQASDNAYHVVTISGENTHLDGFAIQDGNANGTTFPHNYGGGILWHGTPPFLQGELTQCVVLFNRARAIGGGMAMLNGLSPTITHCTFSSNTATNEGGGIALDGASPSFNYCQLVGNESSFGGGLSNARSNAIYTNCIFDQNRATSTEGGAVFNSGVCSPIFRGCQFMFNSSVEGGNAMTSYNPSGAVSPIVSNCTFTNNTGGSTILLQRNQFGASIGTGVLTVRNTIIWNNTLPASNSPAVNYQGGAGPDIQYSDVQNCANTPGCASGTGNLSQDPMFVTVWQGGSQLQLAGNSPLINAGDPNTSFFLLSTPPLDANALFRLVGNRIDMGAFEHQLLDGIYSVQSGDWESGSTWSTSRPPTRSDKVVVRHQITVPPLADVPFEARAVSFGQGGRFTMLPAGKLRLGTRVWYVKPTVTGTGDGSSWANASGNLQATLLAAQSGDEVWVQRGLYKPSSASNPTYLDQSQSFSITPGTRIYGGFAGTETSLFQRHVNVGPPQSTTLSGAIGTTATTDNSFHVVWIQNATPGTLLDGFEISEGGTPMSVALPATPGANMGGGIFNTSTAGQRSSPTIQNCVISRNQAGLYGGGMANNGAGAITLRNCLLAANITQYGGAIYSPAIPVSGGGFTSAVEVYLINCTLTNNQALEDGKAIYGGYLGISNSIIWGNTIGISEAIAAYASGSQISYSTVQEASASAIYQGGTVSSLDPKVDSVHFFLWPDSPCIDRGNPNSFYTGVGGVDLSGQYRIWQGRVDQGCFEYGSFPAGWNY